MQAPHQGAFASASFTGCLQALLEGALASAAFKGALASAPLAGACKRPMHGAFVSTPPRGAGKGPMKGRVQPRHQWVLPSSQVMGLCNRQSLQTLFQILMTSKLVSNTLNLYSNYLQISFELFAKRLHHMFKVFSYMSTYLRIMFKLISKYVHLMFN